MDKIDKTPARNEAQLTWDNDAKARLDSLVESPAPVLHSAFSASETPARLRPERTPASAGETIVTADCLREAPT